MNKVLLVTGASSGIGKATARAASAQGFRLALAARSMDKLRPLVEELGGQDSALPIQCDVQNESDQKAMVQQIADHFGRLDGVFANAGRGGSPGGFSHANPADWKDMLMTNVYGVGLSIQHCLPLLRETKGHILLTGSVAGRVTITGSMYSATKWAVTAMGYGLREELRGSGVRVTLIQPGVVDTPFFDQLPDGTALLPDDVANAVTYALGQPPHVDINEIVVRATPPIQE